MTDPHEEHGEILRRLLNAEADTVTPSAEGLERIRTRIDERRNRRFGWAWFTASWARPVLAVGAAVAIAGIGVSAPQTASLFTSPAGNKGVSTDDNHGNAGGAANGQAPPNGSQSQGSPPPSQNGTPDPSASPTVPSASSTSTCPPPGSGTGGSQQSAASPSPGATSTPPVVTCQPQPQPTAPATTPPVSPPVTDPPTENPPTSPTPSSTASEQTSTGGDSSGAQTP